MCSPWWLPPAELRTHSSWVRRASRTGFLISVPALQSNLLSWPTGCEWTRCHSLHPINPERKWWCGWTRCSGLLALLIAAVSRPWSVCGMLHACVMMEAWMYWNQWSQICSAIAQKHFLKLMETYCVVYLLIASTHKKIQPLYSLLLFFLISDPDATRRNQIRAALQLNQTWSLTDIILFDQII